MKKKKTIWYIQIGGGDRADDSLVKVKAGTRAEAEALARDYGFSVNRVFPRGSLGLKQLWGGYLSCAVKLNY